MVFETTSILFDFCEFFLLVIAYLTRLSNDLRMFKLGMVVFASLGLLQELIVELLVHLGDMADGISDNFGVFGHLFIELGESIETEI